MSLPKHIAIVMDGNGRWAKQHKLLRIAGHKVGAESVRTIIRLCAAKKIPVLSLFAFSTENWERPQTEVTYLMELFSKVLLDEVDNLHKNNIQFRIIGDLTRLNEKLQQQIQKAVNKTASNTGLIVVIALSYSGRWDITAAARNLGNQIANGQLKTSDITIEEFQHNLSTSDLPDPDLFIRTSGEMRISNFMLWQLAYTELYFTEVFWPDFREQEFNNALDDFAKRTRRFGKTNDNGSAI